jgi:hypothetical protein
MQLNEPELFEANIDQAINDASINVYRCLWLFILGT